MGNKTQFAASSVAIMMVLTTHGCSSISAKITREDIAGATIQFTPTVARGGISTWWYQFKTDGSQVLGCNSEKTYTGTDWSVVQAANVLAVTVHFGSAWERYRLQADRPDLESGTFHYDSSPQVQMDGTWQRVSSAPCGANGSDAGACMGPSTFTGAWPDTNTPCGGTATTTWTCVRGQGGDVDRVYECDPQTCRWDVTACLSTFPSLQCTQACK
jgi:hypothetical protein